MELSKEQIQQNKDTFLALVSSINVPGADIGKTIEYLTSSDFFTAPASTVYHCNFEGGLCYHSLNVYNHLVFLYNAYKDIIGKEYSDDTLKIVGLFHDISKANYYEQYVQNKKVYDERGSKHDNKGKFDWIAQDAYKVRDAEERFLAGEHGFNSLMILNTNQLIPLTEEETIAIVQHHCGLGEARPLSDLSAIMNRYPLLTLLHTADMLSTFVVERNE